MASSAAEAHETEPLLPEPWRVRETRREAADVVTLVLEPDGASPRPFRPGQFNMLYMFGIGEVPISISGDASDDSTFVHTVRDVGAVTHALCNCAVGDVVGVRGPFGQPWPIDSCLGHDLLVVAGGIGLAPLRPILYAAIGGRSNYDDVVLLYGARRPEDLLFTDELDAWRQRGIQVEVTVDHADPSWSGHIGVVTTLIREARFDAEQASAFLCGPEIMMRFCARELTEQGVPEDRTYVSMERNMKCAIGFCGHCQFGPELLCIDGPVFPWPRVRNIIGVREL